ncbi:hypothetical protein Lal_00026925 [Lupinus albus]|nr:hypothetical protein Lal_00026925 [Lupinus albus]
MLGPSRTAAEVMVRALVCVSPHPLTKPIVPLGAHPNEIMTFNQAQKSIYSYQKANMIQYKTSPVSFIPHFRKLITVKCLFEYPNEKRRVPENPPV